VALTRHARLPGLREVSILWGLYLFVAAEVFATYSRLPVHELYHVSENGRSGGAGRALVFFNWPVALATIPMLAVVASDARSRAVSRLAIVAALLCAAVFWPGVVDQANLDATWWNAIAASGVALALGITLFALLRNGLGPNVRTRGDRMRWSITAVLVLLALPWLAADLGFLIGRWPLFGSLYESDEWYAPFGHVRVHRAVHAGNHHGLVGALLVVTVLLLSRTLPRLTPRLRAFVGVYLSILVLYGLANVANDFWLEQVVKRGATQWEFPSMVVPSPTLKWLILLVLATVLYAFVFRRIQPGWAAGNRGPLWPAVLGLPLAALIVIGLVHGGTRHRTQLGAADGIVFTAAPNGTSHIYVTRPGRVVQLTIGDRSDLAPVWSPDRHRIAFQSNRDGNWEIYVMRADGSGVRRLTDDDAEDGEPSWSANGHIEFARDGRLFAIAPDGRDEHSLGKKAIWPRAARSPRRELVAWQCRHGGHWHICVAGSHGRLLRVLAVPGSDALAPTWSPDGRRIAFIGDRDGPDELFAIRADGTGLVRLTGRETEIDTPMWAAG
jgi:WD40-like Beta Propeller Repeat